MDDLIYRNVLIDELKKIKFPCMLPSGAEYLDGIQTAVRRISGVINDAPAVNQWIPCHERLPEHYNEILFCERNRTIHKGYMYWDGTFIENYLKFQKGDIIAWMPMPNAYEQP